MDTAKIEGREIVYAGEIVTLRRDTVRVDGAAQVREVVEHPDSVAVAAFDARNRVLLVRRYRHPIAGSRWELPAGLLDRPGETPLDAAHRELAEEAGLHAAVWQPLIEVYPSPGVLTEYVQVWTACDLSAAPYDDRERLDTRWVTLRHAVDMVFAAEITDGLSVAGLLAAAHRQPLAPPVDR